ncbi:MAG: hypothetical protein WDN04_24330 [Rhodospirillales bacterium]
MAPGATAGAGHHHTHRVQGVVDFLGIEHVQGIGKLRLGRQPGGDEIVLQHGHPAIVGLGRNPGLALVDVAEFDLVVFLLVGIERGPVKVETKSLLAGAGCAVARNLEIGKGMDGGGSLVGDFIAHVDHVTRAVEHEYLVHLDSAHGGCA